MSLSSFIRPLLVACSLAALSLPSVAQEISPSHLQAARDAVAAIRATSMYDNILPQAAFALKQEMIQQNPDKQEVISKLVDEKTLDMVKRRADLEREAATAYAKVLSEEDLQNIATFYTSPTGKKLLEDGPIVTREVMKAADIWQRGIARDLAQTVGQELVKLDAAAGVKAPAPAEATPAPAEESGEQAPAPAQN